MQQIILLLLKSVTCTGVLFTYYLLFLRGKKLHQFNRWYLLSAVVLGLVIPFLSFKTYTLTTGSPSEIVLLNAIESGKDYELSTTATTHHISTETIVACCCLLVSTVLLLILLARVAWVYKLKRKGMVNPKDGYNLVLTDSTKAPFSFLNNLFWKKDIDMESTAGQQILVHELCHIRQRHTLDKLFMQLVLTIGWTNPFLWLIGKELAMQHEFIADDAAIADNDTDAFARMILQAKYTNISPDIIHPFFHSSIKRRLTMLTSNKKTRCSTMRMLLTLPLAASVLLLLSFKLDVPKANRANKAISVIFDAGHGGQDIGAIGVKGLQEKDLNLEICNKLVELAPEYNINARLTRNDDNSLSLQDRIALSEKSNTDLFIAIHIAKSEPEHPATGFEVVVSGKNKFPTQSRLLASAIVPKLSSLSVPTKLVQRGLVVVNDASRPAILIECGNIDDARQMGVLTDNTGLESFCRQILSGIADYKNSSK